MAANAMTASPQRRPEFFWQGLLIVLPVILLTGIGLFALRQDRILAQHEATERAQNIADELAQTLWTELTSIPPTQQSNYPIFRVSRSGELLFPPPYNSVPIPQPFDIDTLSAEQQRSWLLLQRTGFTVQDRADRISAARQFIQLGPPERFAAAAQYRLGLLLLENGEPKAAMNALAELRLKHPDATGESGLPLQPLADLKFAEAAALQNGNALLQFGG